MKYRVGQREHISRTISEADVNLFAEITGDCNPLHLDEEAAEKSVFGKRIAHGMLVGSLLSSVIGMKLPGIGTIYLEQNLKFLKPVYLGDTVTAEVEIAEILNEEKRILRLNTQILNQDSVLVVDGYAVVKAP